MPDTSFQDAVGYILGTRDERSLGLFCPRCAFDRLRALTTSADEIVYIETVAKAGLGARCSHCEIFPLVLSARELLRPTALASFMGAVLKMAESEAARRDLRLH